MVLTTVRGHHTDVRLYNAAGDISHVTTNAGIKWVSTYDEVTDLQRQAPYWRLGSPYGFPGNNLHPGKYSLPVSCKGPSLCTITARTLMEGHGDNFKSNMKHIARSYKQILYSKQSYSV